MRNVYALAAAVKPSLALLILSRISITLGRLHTLHIEFLLPLTATTTSIFSLHFRSRTILSKHELSLVDDTNYTTRSFMSNITGTVCLNDSL